ncbi:acetyltransferase [Brevundimonas staleyi]|uniref:acetyltransferase n=1 Tax=Brevundimonas staleyi TaxID=74326 RepID=UPI0035A6EFB4
MAILGGGGHARSVASSAERAGWTSLALFDDRSPEAWERGPWPVSGSTDDWAAAVEAYQGVLIGVGDNVARLALHLRASGLGAPATTLIDPSASVSRHAHIGAGSVVLAAACVNVQAQLGQAVIVNTAATVDHDCRLGDGVHVSPGANLAGGVVVGARSWIGIGAVVRQGVAIGCDAVIGAGAVVLADVPDGLTVVGNPARKLER